ncbi:MAG: type II toxin-antitoxin system RelE/ParE family toxin [Planctomycetota bacterium]
MPGYRLSDSARVGIGRIVFYVEEHFGEEVAQRVLSEFEAAFEMLAANPGLGHRRDDLTSDPQVRFWSVRPSLVAYRSLGGIVQVLFVERGERDWERLLDEES